MFSYNLLETTRICGVLLTPFMPGSNGQALRPDRPPPSRPGPGRAPQRGGECRRRPPSTKGENLFPRVDVGKKALQELEQAAEAARKAGLPALETEPLLEEKVDFGHASARAICAW